MVQETYPDNVINNFFTILENYGEFISIPKDLAEFCQINFKLDHLESSSELIYTVQKLLEPKYLNKINEDQFNAILSSLLPEDLRKAIYRNLISRRDQANITERKELIKTVTGVECERISASKYRIDFIDERTPSTTYLNDKVSLVLDQHELTDLYEKLVKIRQQLLESVGAREAQNE